MSTAVDVILDTGTSLAYVDKKTGRKLINGILSGIMHFKFAGQYYIPCGLTKYKSVYLNLGGYYLEIPPATYVSNMGGSLCNLGFGLSSEWLLGDILFRNYYTVWDADNSKVGFALRKGSAATTAPYK